MGQGGRVWEGMFGTLVRFTTAIYYLVTSQAGDPFSEVPVRDPAQFPHRKGTHPAQNQSQCGLNRSSPSNRCGGF